MDVNDDVLRLVLERVASHASLVRAAAVCKRWRRAIADAAFLRRFRFLHAPAVAGDYHNPSPLDPLVMAGVTRRCTAAVFVPSSTSVHARHYSLDFLPDSSGAGVEPWKVVDSRGSLLLMARGHIGLDLSHLTEMVVCEPLTQRYSRVPPLVDFDHNSCYFSCLIDGYADQAGGCIGMSNFRVFCMLDRNDGAHHDLIIASNELVRSWSKRTIDQIVPKYMPQLGHAGGSWYFDAYDRTMVVLDGSTGELSSSELPAIDNWSFINLCVTDGRDGKPRMVTVFADRMKVFVELNGGGWALEKRVLLSEAVHGLPGYQPAYFILPLCIVTRGPGFVILSPELGGPWPFSIDLETMEAAPAAEDMGQMLYRCELPWPPALHACLD